MGDQLGPLQEHRDRRARVAEEGCIPSAAAHDRYAEDVLVGQMLRFPEVAFRMRRILPPDAFYAYTTQAIVSAIYDVAEKTKTVNVVLVRDRLRRLGELALAGDEVGLMDLADCAVSPVGAMATARIVHEYWICRQVYAWGRDLVAMWGETLPVSVADAIRAAKIASEKLSQASAALDAFDRAQRLTTRRRTLSGRHPRRRDK
jgi:replicative DNA helicase